MRRGRDMQLRAGGGGVSLRPLCPGAGSACRRAALRPLESCALENESERKWAGRPDRSPPRRSGPLDGSPLLSPDGEQRGARTTPRRPGADAMPPACPQVLTSVTSENKRLAQRSLKLQKAEGVGNGFQPLLSLK